MYSIYLLQSNLELHVRTYWAVHQSFKTSYCCSVNFTLAEKQKHRNFIKLFQSISFTNYICEVQIYYFTHVFTHCQYRNLKVCIMVILNSKSWIIFLRTFHFTLLFSEYLSTISNSAKLWFVRCTSWITY